MEAFDFFGAADVREDVAGRMTLKPRSDQKADIFTDPASDTFVLRQHGKSTGASVKVSSSEMDEIQAQVQEIQVENHRVTVAPAESMS